MEPCFTDFKTATDHLAPKGERANMPLIGLSVNIAEETSRLHEAYIRAVGEAGGVPVLIPATTNAEILRRTVDTIDGLILTGGADVGGQYFGEKTLEGIAEVVPERDGYDFLLLRLAADRQVPILGICRGMQVINIAFGGDIWQDIPSEYPGEPLDHSVLSPREKPCHPVNIEKDSRLATIIGKEVIGVNSRHHQAVRRLAEGFRAVAAAPDGIVEAIEGFPGRRIMGVQWHPENLAAEGGCQEMKALFGSFINEAAIFRKAKKIHDHNLSVDSHCDTPTLFESREMDFGRRDPDARVDLVKMEEGRLDAAVMAAYIPQGGRDEISHKKAFEKAVSMLEITKRHLEANSEYAGLAFSFADAEALKRQGRKAIFLGVENGYAIGDDLTNLQRLHGMGAVYMTLCHNGANDICDSAVGDPEHGGLSGFGRKVVGEMNRLGMVIDLSHAAQSTFFDVLRVGKAPVICSHSSVRALCDHPRNLTDDQLQALARAGGVIQICLYGPFLKEDGTATITDAADHIDHAVRVAGIDHVGIGSDFDGGGGLPGCDGANGIINITVELLRRGYTEKEIAKILGGNLRRVVDTVQETAPSRLTK
ncbi:MAG: membrane dipeptidase [Rikenellaceae bacterium]|nr:membrane dipeptidase [Rikenellaceae bacterium]